MREARWTSEIKQYLSCIRNEQDDQLAVCCHVKNFAKGSVFLVESAGPSLGFRGGAPPQANGYLNVASRLLQ